MPSGFYNGEIMFADNVNFSGAEQPGQVTTDGQLLIGSSVAPNIRVANLTSTDASIAITNGNGTIDLSANPSGVASQAVIIANVDVDLKTVGDTVLFTPLSDFILTDIVAYAKDLSGTIGSPIINVGTNSASYDNFFAGLTLSTTDGNYLLSFSGNDNIVIPTGMPLVVRVDTADATATTNTQEIYAVGFYTTAQSQNTISPLSVVEFYDDFFATTSSWSGASTTPMSQQNGVAVAGRPGVVCLAAAPNLTVTKYLFLGQALGNSGGIVLGGGVIEINWLFNLTILSDATNDYTFTIGIGDTALAAQVNGIWFQYNHALNSGNWTINTSSASSPTNTNTAVAVTTSWVKCTIVINSTASSIEFFIDGVSVGTITTTIPTTGMRPMFVCQRNAGSIAATTLMLDAFYLKQTLTTPR